MSGRRKFGSVLVRSARDGHKYVQARYQPPVWAYSKWPDLPRRYTKNFDAEYTAMAEAWLAEQERLIKLGSWEPPRIEKTKELSSTITFREYALDFVQNRRKPNGQRIAPTTREKYLQYLDDYLLPVLGDKPMGGIGPAGHREVGRLHEGGQGRRGCLRQAQGICAAARDLQGCVRAGIGLGRNHSAQIQSGAHPHVQTDGSFSVRGYQYGRAECAVSCHAAAVRGGGLPVRGHGAPAGRGVRAAAKGRENQGRPFRGRA